VKRSLAGFCHWRSVRSEAENNGKTATRNIRKSPLELFLRLKMFDPSDTYPCTPIEVSRFVFNKILALLCFKQSLISNSCLVVIEAQKNNISIGVQVIHSF